MMLTFDEFTNSKTKSLNFMWLLPLKFCVSCNKALQLLNLQQNNFSFQPRSLPTRLSDLAKEVVLFCSLASMKVVWINTEWIALIFVVYCPAQSLFWQCGWRRWCFKIPDEHSTLVTETSLYLFHSTAIWIWNTLVLVCDILELLEMTM